MARIDVIEAVQAAEARAELADRNERIAEREAEMARVQRELKERSDALTEARASLADLKGQVQSQLKELQETSTPPPPLATCVGLERVSRRARSRVERLHATTQHGGVRAHCGRGAERELATAKQTVSQQASQINALRGDLAAASDAVKDKERDVSALQGKVIQIRSHALKLEEELRALRSGEVSNVYRVSELRDELEVAQQTAGAGCLHSTGCCACPARLSSFLVMCGSCVLRFTPWRRASHRGVLTETDQGAGVIGVSVRAGSAQQALQRMKRDLSEVASRERSLADAVEKLAKELFESKQSAKAAASDMDSMRSQVDALQANLRSKDDQLEKLKASLQHGSQVCAEHGPHSIPPTRALLAQVLSCNMLFPTTDYNLVVGCVQMMEQRELEIKSLRSEIDKLRRREQSWSLELQDAAAVTSSLTERMELLEAALATKEDSLKTTEVRVLFCLVLEGPLQCGRALLCRVTLRVRTRMLQQMLGRRCGAMG